MVWTFPTAILAGVPHTIAQNGGPGAAPPRTFAQNGGGAGAAPGLPPPPPPFPGGWLGTTLRPALQHPVGGATPWAHVGTLPPYGTPWPTQLAPAAARAGAATHVSDEVIAATRLRERDQVLAVRPQSTKNAYGNTKTCGSGPALEWAMWCAASAGEMVYGLLTRPDKVVYDQIVTPEKALLYLESHVALRPELLSNHKPKPGTQAGPSTIKKHKKMLGDLHVQQCADDPVRMKGIGPPRMAVTSGLISGSAHYYQ